MKKIALSLFIIVSTFVCAAAQKPEWKKISADQYVVTASFPCDPEFEAKPDTEALKEYSQYSCMYNNTVFLLQRSQLTTGVLKITKARLDELNEAFVKGIGATDFTQRPVMLGRYAGRASVFNAASTKPAIDFRTRFYIINGYSYSFVAAVPAGTSFTSETDRFLASGALKK